MLSTVNDMSSISGLTSARIRQILVEENLEYTRKGDAQKGHIRLPNNSCRKILTHSGITFSKTRAIIGQVKGGVGKSFLTFNTAVERAKNGAKGLIIDCDPDCTMTNYLLPDDFDYAKLQTLFEVKRLDTPIKDVILKSRYEGLDFVAAKSILRKLESDFNNVNLASFFKTLLEDIEEKYDFIFFDVPANFSKLAMAAYLYVDKVFMPVLPDINAIEDVDLTMETIKEDGAIYSGAKFPEYRIIRNKFSKTKISNEKNRSRGRIASRDADALLKEDYGKLLVDVVIPDTTDVQKCINEGVSVFENKVNDNIIRRRISEFAEEICPFVRIEDLAELETVQ